MPTTNRDMADMLRKRRSDMSSYMYGGTDAESPTEDAAEPANAETTEANPPADTPPTDQPQPIQVLAPGDPSDPDKYTYEKMDTGAWMVYPPGVPCEAGKSRIQLDHAATDAEYADMDQALEVAGGTGENEASSEKTAEGGAY